jgi:plasmid stability protein
LVIRLDDPTHEALELLATEQQLGMSAAARLILRQALRSGGQPAGLPAGAPPEDALDQLQLVSLAGLVAAEQAVRFLALVHPDGELRMRELRQAAVGAAELRLEELKEQLDGGPPR